jgi:hypothetical protein
MALANRWILPTVVGLCFLPATPTFAQRNAKEAKQVAEQYITQAQLRDYLTFIASDELEGRETPSRGLDTAARFLATMAARAGAKPGGDDGTFFQKIILARRSADMEKCSATLGEAALKIGDDFLPQLDGGSGTVAGPLVYVGNGFVIPSKNIDSYKGIDVKGKVLIVNNRRLPEGVGPRDIPQSGRGKDWWGVRDYARKNGAAGIVYLPGSANEDFWRLMRRQVERPNRNFSPVMEKEEGNDVPAIMLSPESTRKLFAGEKLDGAAVLERTANAAADQPFALSEGKRLSFTTAVSMEKQMTQNVVAIVEGSDPKLKNEYIALGAHYDHEGIRPEIQQRGQDGIWNGADDDGSGTVALLAIAEAMAKNPNKPKRSTIFVWHCGEEKGLWGSAYFADNPTVPLNSILVQINIDMIGRSKPAGDTERRNAELAGPNAIYVIGSRRLSTEFGDLVAQVNKNYLNMTYDYRYDAPNDPNGFYFRSDHYNYAKKGIPVAFFFNGVHVDYHRPGDTADKIDYVRYEKITRTVLMTVAEVANRPVRPKVDKPVTDE